MSQLVYRYPTFECLGERTVFDADVSPVAVVEFSDVMQVCESFSEQSESDSANLWKEKGKEKDGDQDDGLDGEGEGGEPFIGPLLDTAAPPVTVSATNADLVIGVVERYDQPIGPTLPQQPQQWFYAEEPNVSAPILGLLQEVTLEVQEVVVQPPVEEAATETNEGEKIELSLKLDGNQASPLLEVRVFSEGNSIEVFDLNVKNSDTTEVTEVSVSVKVKDLPASSAAPIVINVSNGDASGSFETTSGNLLKAFEDAKEGKIPTIIYENGTVPAKDIPISFSTRSSQNVVTPEVEVGDGEVSGSNSLGNFFRSASNFLLKLVGMA